MTYLHIPCWDLTDLAQNIHDPELYLHSYDLENDVTGERVGASGMFCEMLESLPGFRANVSSSAVVTQERLPLHCVSIPGETAWATAATRRSGAIWRPRPASERSAVTAQKRPHLGDDEDDAMPDCDTSATPPGDAKRSRAAADGAGDRAGAATPAGAAAGAIAAVVKMYGAPAARDGDGAIKVRRHPAGIRRLPLAFQLPRRVASRPDATRA